MNSMMIYIINIIGVIGAIASIFACAKSLSAERKAKEAATEAERITASLKKKYEFAVFSDIYDKLKEAEINSNVLQNSRSKIYARGASRSSINSTIECIRIGANLVYENSGKYDKPDERRAICSETENHIHEYRKQSNADDWVVVGKRIYESIRELTRITKELVDKRKWED